MATERNTRRELLKKLLALGPVAALAGAFGVNGPRQAEAFQYATLTVQDKLGVGTDTPSTSSKLHIEGAGGAGSTELIRLTKAGGYGQSNLYQYYLDDGARCGLNINDLLRIDTAQGKVGIGTPTPNAKLHIEGVTGAGSTELIRLTKAGGYGQSNLYLYYADGTHYGVSINDILRVDVGQGYVGIGVPTPAVKLDVAGDIHVSGKLLGTAESACYSS